jgi:hypothetical protein
MLRSSSSGGTALCPIGACAGGSVAGHRTGSAVALLGTVALVDIEVGGISAP